MEKEIDISAVWQLLGARRLRTALDRLEAFSYKHPELRLSQRIESVRNDYGLMADYWRRGYKDKSLDSVYNDIIYKVYTVSADAYTSYCIRRDSFLAETDRRVRGNGRDDDFLTAACNQLEDFVSNSAVLQLQPEHVRGERMAELQAKHQRFLSDVFDYVWTSGQWNDGTMQQLKHLLTSPTVDAADQQVIVAAVTLGVSNVFDINKLRLLVDVYTTTTDEYVKQRALVGIVIALWSGDDRLFPQMGDIAKRLADDERACEELTELQIQLLYCVNAERDTNVVQKEIMPELIKNNGLHITPTGIEERDDDPMQDILNPQDEERNIEKIEEGMKRMVDMQRSGSDIYFGGFAHMKRFPFFNTVANWFTPYYKSHPQIRQLYANEKDLNIADKMVDSIMLCNNDKFSFVIVFQQVVNRLPASLREMMEHSRATLEMTDVKDDDVTPAYIRRIYLQDIYRFFRLFHKRTCFNSPFDDGDVDGSVPGYVFFANSVFRGTPLDQKLNYVVASMIKQKLYAAAIDVLAIYSDDAKDYYYYMYCGNMLLRHNSLALRRGLAAMDACECFTKALSVKPDDEKALFGLARAKFYSGRYVDAARAYKRLAQQKPDTRRYAVGYCVCLTNLARYDEATPLLYKINYEHPDDDNVKRVLARSLVGSGKYEQAEGMYASLATNEVEDTVNRGYCNWFKGDVNAAVQLFAEYVSELYPDADTETKRAHCYADIIESESDYIKAHGVTDTESLLMADAIRDAIVR